MRRSARTVAVAIALASFTSAQLLGAMNGSGPIDSCADCKPTTYNQHTALSGEYEICFQQPAAGTTFSSSQITEFMSGVQSYWGSFLADAEVNISFAPTAVVKTEPEECGSNGITVKLDPTPPRADMVFAPTSNGRGATIRINPNETLAPDANFKWLGAHEGGHFLDFKNVDDPDCFDESVMSGGGGNGYAFPSGGNPLGCADFQKASDRWVAPPQTGGGEEWYPAPESECWDVWQVTYTWCPIGKGVYRLCGIGANYLGVYCFAV